MLFNHIYYFIIFSIHTSLTIFSFNLSDFLISKLITSHFTQCSPVFFQQPNFLQFHLPVCTFHIFLDYTTVICRQNIYTCIYTYTHYSTLTRNRSPDFCVIHIKTWIRILGTYNKTTLPNTSSMLLVLLHRYNVKLNMCVYLFIRYLFRSCIRCIDSQDAMNPSLRMFIQIMLIASPLLLLGCLFKTINLRYMLHATQKHVFMVF